MQHSQILKDLSVANRSREKQTSRTNPKFDYELQIEKYTHQDNEINAVVSARLPGPWTGCLR